METTEQIPVKLHVILESMMTDSGIAIFSEEIKDFRNFDEAREYVDGLERQYSIYQRIAVLDRRFASPSDYMPALRQIDRIDRSNIFPSMSAYLILSREKELHIYINECNTTSQSNP